VIAGIGKAQGAVGASLVDEFGGKNSAVVYFPAIEKLLFIDQGELIAFADIQRKVDIPAENIDHFHNQRVTESRFLTGFEKGRINLANRIVGALFNAPDLDGGSKALFLTLYMQAPQWADLINEFLQMLIFVDLKFEYVTRAQVFQQGRVLAQAHDLMQFTRLQLMTLENAGQGVPGFDFDAKPL